MARRTDPDYNARRGSIPQRIGGATLVAAIAVVAGLASGTPAAAWKPETHLLIAESASAIAPADLERLIDRHRHRFNDGALAPCDRDEADAHFKNENGTGRLDEWIDSEVELTIQAIREHRPFENIVYRLGVLSHFVADANNPLHTDESDPREGAYFTDYLNYIEKTQDRFALVFYGEGRDLVGNEALAPMLDRTFARSRKFYRSIGREYRRVGGPPGRTKFDDKSVAFAVGSLALSHAVSDVGAVLRYVWIEAGGADDRDLPLTEPEPSERR